MGWAHRLEDCNDPADFGYCTCAIYSCGYSQPHRDWLTFKRLKDGTAETDCSYGVGQWLAWGGFISENPGFSTATERQWLTQYGFIAIDANAGFVKMQRNDVLLRDRNDAKGILGHTALYIGDGMQAEALRDEHHAAGYEGTTPGDQDGGETVVRPLTFDWDWILRKRDQPNPVAPIPTDEGNQMTFIFSCDSNDHMWLYDGGRVVQIRTETQQETLKEAHLMATGRDMPQFHLKTGGSLIDLLG